MLPPDVIIVNAPAHDTYEADANFTFTASVSGAMFECALNGTDYEPCSSPWTYQDLLPGLYVFRVRAVVDGIVDESPAVHAWRVRPPAETEEPDTTITAMPPATTTSSSATFRFTASELGTTYECSLDGSAFAACNSGITYPNLSVGEHTFRVRAIDAFDNVESEPASYTWVRTTGDGTPPIVLITDAPPINPDTGVVESDNARFEFEANEPVQGYLCSLDGAPYAGCTSPIEYLNLSPMLHQFRVKATDVFGNVGVATMYEWETIDVTPPDTQLIDGNLPTNPSGSSTARFEFTGTDNVTVIEGEVQVLEFECRLNGGNWTNCTSPANYANLQPGLNTFEVRAVDSEGNVDASPASYAWVILDGTPPETTIDSAPPASTQDTSASFQYSSNEGGSLFSCSLDGADFVECNLGSVSYTDLEVGAHWFQVAATDSAGLVDDSPASYVWTILPPPDTTDPQTTIDSGPAAETLATTARIFFSADEPANFKCSFNGGSFNQCTSPFQIANLTVGTYTLAVEATDLEGNVDDTPATFTWKVIPPVDTTIGGTPIDPTDATSATFTFTASQANASFECALDTHIETETWTACDSGTITYDGLAQGEHEFAVRASVGVDNVDPSPATFSWEIGDVTPPVITITDGPGDGSGATVTNENTATFTFSADPALEFGWSFVCTLDGGAPMACSSPFELDAADLAASTGIPSGEHSFEVSAVGQNLLVDPEPAVYDWTVEDTIAPETTVESTVPARVPVDLEPPLAITFGSNENLATFQCTLNGEDLGQCAGPPDNTYIADLPAGAYTLEVAAVDASLEANVDTSPVVVNFTVVGPPVTTIDTQTAPTDPTTDLTATFTFDADQDNVTYICSLDEVGFSECESPMTYTEAQLSAAAIANGDPATALGDHSFRVIAINDFGLMEDPPALHEWTIELPLDTVGPTTTISGPTTTQLGLPATFVLSGTDNQTLAADLSFECTLDGAGRVLRLAVRDHRPPARRAHADRGRGRRHRQHRRDARRATPGRSYRRCRRTRRRARTSVST